MKIFPVPFPLISQPRDFFHPSIALPAMALALAAQRATEQQDAALAAGSYSFTISLKMLGKMTSKCSLDLMMVWGCPKIW